MSRTPIENLTTLGLTPGATLEEIKKSYRRLAIHWHPDKNKTPEAEEQFKKIGSAYKDLTDPKSNIEIAGYIPPLPRTWENTVKRAKEFLECATFKGDLTAIGHWTDVLQRAHSGLSASIHKTNNPNLEIEAYGFDFGNIQFEGFRRDFARDVVLINRDATRPFLAWLETRKSNASSTDLVYFNTPYFQRCISIAEYIAGPINIVTLARIQSIAKAHEPIKPEELNVLFLLTLRTNNLTLIAFFLKELQVDINNLVTVSYEAHEFLEHFFLISPLCFSLIDDVNTETILFLLTNGADPNLAMRKPSGGDLRHSPPILLAIKAPSLQIHCMGFDCEYPERKREIDTIVTALLQHGADATILSKVQESYYEPNYLYMWSGTKYQVTDSPVLQPFYTYFHIYSRIILETIRGINDSINTYTDKALSHDSITKKEADIYFKKHQQEVLQYLKAMHSLLALDYRLTIITAKDEVTLGDFLVLAISFFAPLFIAELRDPRSKRERKLTEESKQHCNALVRCRMAFNQAIDLMKADQAGFEKYLTQAFKHDEALFHDLTVNLLTQKGACLEVNLTEMPNIAREICNLEIVRNTAKLEALTVLAKISNSDEQEFIENYLNPEHKTQPIVDSVNKDHVTKEALLSAYEKLITIRKNQIQSLARVTAQTKEMQSKKTSRILSWHDSFWKALGDYCQDLKKSFAVIEGEIRDRPHFRSILSPYKPILNNMDFFNRYLAQSITGEESHSFNRIAYCMSFIASMNIRYEPNKKDLPAIELLKNLYMLKGLLLAEVHSQSYLKNLFNCAMTSRLAHHVLSEINSIEKMLKRTKKSADKKIQRGKHTLKVSNIDIDRDPEILQKRQELEVLEQYYGTAWRRFKTAVLTSKQMISEEIDPQILTRREHCVASLGHSGTLFSGTASHATPVATESYSAISKEAH